MLILSKRPPACFQKNTKSFPVGITVSLVKTAEQPSPSAVSCTSHMSSVHLPSPAGQRPYDPPLIEAETKTERGHVTTPGHPGRKAAEVGFEPRTHPRQAIRQTPETSHQLQGSGSPGSGSRQQRQSQEKTNQERHCLHAPSAETWTKTARRCNRKLQPRTPRGTAGTL